MRKSATVVVVMTIAATYCFAEATCQHCKKKGILLEFVMQQSLEVANIGALRLGGSRAQRSATGEASKAREERPMLHLGCEQTDPIVVDVSVRLVWGVNCRHRGSAFVHTANFTMEMTDLVSTKKVVGTTWMWLWM